MANSRFLVAPTGTTSVMIEASNEGAIMTSQLTPGTIFPDLSLQIACGDVLSLPADLNTTYTVVLFYRGHW